MAVKSLGQWTEKNKKLARKIKSCRIDTGEAIDKIVSKARISRSTYHNHMRNPENITVGELRVYISTLKIPKEDIISALYFDKEGE